MTVQFDFKGMLIEKRVSLKELAGSIGSSYNALYDHCKKDKITIKFLRRIEKAVGDCSKCIQITK